MSNDLRKRLKDAEKLIAEFLRDEEEEPGTGGGVEGRTPATGLSMIPTSRIAEPGQSASVVVRYRPSPSDTRQFGDGPTAAAPPTVEIRVSYEDRIDPAYAVTLVDRGDYSSKTITLPPQSEGDLAQVQARYQDRTVDGVVEWRHRPSPTVDALMFNHASYSIRDEGQRVAYLYAPWDLVAQGDVSPRINLVGDPGITYQKESYSFAFDQERQAAVCAIRLRGSGVGSRGRLTASVADQTVAASVKVTARGIQGVKIDLREVDLTRRAWLDVSQSSLVVNAKAKVIARYLGSKTNGWPGQDSLPFRTMLAEVLATTVVRDVLSRKHLEPPPVERLFAEYEDRMEKLLPRLHAAFVPSAELRASYWSEDAVA